jgi:adenine-specific DNA-methyltransferase
LKAIESLTENGVICFVLPSEILQVNYARAIRKYLLETFQRIEIFAFNELIFDKIQQDVIVLIGVKKILLEKDKGVSFYQVDQLEDLKIPDYLQKHSNVHRKNLDKWTNFILSDEELNFIEEVTRRLDLKRIKDYCEKVEVGIVTAANDYFIVNNEIVKEQGLRKYAKPILQKGAQIRMSSRITKSIFNDLKAANKKIFLLHFPERPKKHLSKEAQTYIYKGEQITVKGKKMHRRYKMRQRTYWYHVPTIWTSEGMFIKRSHIYPRILINDAKVCVTDSFYRINMKRGYNINNLSFSFNNTLSFVLAELEGRFYGGGVLELTPNEFKNLYIPYNRISIRQVRNLERMIENNNPIESILNFSDELLLNQLKTKERVRLREIWTKLVERRRKISVEQGDLEDEIQEEVFSLVAEPE